MPTEYWLQKRTLTMWSHVTYYMTLEEAQANLKRAKGNGYSWRIMKCEVVEECLNEGERAIEQDNPKPTASPAGEFKSSWGGEGSSWAKPLTSEADFKSEHGSKGSVWVGNPSTKEKRRVPAAESVGMLENGWQKVGPRTVL